MKPNVIWYANPTGGTALAATTVLVNGSIYYASIIDGSGCESFVRLAINANVSSGTTPTTNNATQNFCQIDNPTLANVQVNESGIIWYSNPTGGTALTATTALVNGAIYYASLIDGSGCESNVRLAINVNVSNGTTPTTNNTTQSFCQVNNPTLANVQVNESGIIWYSGPTGGTALTATTALVNGAIYYASLIDGSGCESSIRLAITVNISNGVTPTTNNATQNFCLVDNPTVASIQVNEPNVTWYSNPTGGTALASSASLVNGAIYYGSLTDGSGCESPVRLAVTVNISNGTTPTINNATQNFCQVNSPTITSIQVNEPNVIWYANATGGTSIASTTPLISGSIYYASLIDGSGCESPVRLAVTVNVSNGTTPTTNNVTQVFCEVSNPTVASIQVNESNIIWYANATGGTALASTTALTDGGIYYASIIDGSGCESLVRLEITTSFFSIDEAAITGGSNEACTFDEVTYTTNSGMTNYIWTITNGTIVSGGQTTDNSVTVSWTNLGVATVSVNYTDSCSGNGNATSNLTVTSCSDLTITKTVDNPTPAVDDNVTFTITVNNVGPSQLLDIVVSELLPSGYTYVSSTTSAGTFNVLSGIWNIPLLAANQSATFTIVVKVLSTGNYTNVAIINSSNPVDSDVSNNEASVFTEPICLVVYNEFSPNSDGSNDLFHIDCIENFPNNTLEVFNRYGVLVYTKNHYINDWDGTANVSGTVNKEDKLPTGTYYFILDVGVDNIKKNGWLSITR